MSDPQREEHRRIRRAAGAGDMNILREVFDDAPNRLRLFSDKDAAGFNSLHYAANSRRVNALELILGAGVNVDTGNGTRCTALYLCIASSNYAAVRACVRLLLDAGADPNISHTSHRETVMSRALQVVHLMSPDAIQAHPYMAEDGVIAMLQKAGGTYTPE